MTRAILITLLLAGCTSTQQAARAPTTPPMYSIVFEAGPFDGKFPVYRLLLNDTLPSTFIGEANTIVVGQRTIGKVGRSNGSYSQVYDALEPWRPEKSVTYVPGQENCLFGEAGMPTVTVAWASGSGAISSNLFFDFGCAAAYPELAKALRDIPVRLEIDRFVDDSKISR